MDAMDGNNTARNSSVLPRKPRDVNCVRTPGDSLEFLLLHLFSGRHEVLEEYLNSNCVPRNILNVCLLEGLQRLNRRNHKNVPHIVQSLQLVLKIGSKVHSSCCNKEKYWMTPYLNCVTPKEIWKNYQMTPYHIICRLPGDYHELLDLMIQAFGPTWIQQRDSIYTTAIGYAVMFNNIGCVRTLLMNGVHPSSCFNSYFSLFNGLTGEIPYNSNSIIRSDILNVLVSSVVDVNEQYSCTDLSPLMYAAATGSIESIRTLIQKNAKFDLTDGNGHTVWRWAVLSGRVDVLECLAEHDNSYQVFGLYWAVRGHRGDMVLYLLSKENNVRKLKQNAEKDKPGDVTPLHSKVNKDRDPCIAAIYTGSLPMVQLLEVEWCHTFHTFGTLKRALWKNMNKQCHKDVLEYLLCKYKYPLNHQYHDTTNTFKTLLTDACLRKSSYVAESLLKHGADPNIKNCHHNGYTAIHYSINKANFVACFIRSGADLSICSYDEFYGNVLPFEAAVLYHNHCAAEMLLLSGCPCGVYSTRSKLEDAYDMTPKMENLMSFWGVRENRVKSLKITCRTAILNHLSPTIAGQKLSKLPLPDCLIRFLGISELDDVISANRNTRIWKVGTRL